jgi:molybdopterin converting factor small subunit
MIHAHLLATFRLIAGVKTIELEPPPGTTILGAARLIVERCPALRAHWFDATGNLHAHVLIFHNGQDAATLPRGLDTALQPGDTLDFLPPVAGG